MLSHYRRYKESVAVLSYIKLRPFSALRQKFKEGYTFSDFKSDLMAGIIVGMVAMPLGMALAIASGVAPQNGLYTVIIGGGLVALLGGSRCQVTGPTAAFVVVLAPIVGKFGLSGLLIAGLLAGVILIAMGLLRMGKLIEFIPYPVTTGFTSGIAVVITTIQVKDFFGLKIKHMPESYYDRLRTLAEAWHTWVPTECFVAFATLAMLLLWPKVNKKIPAPLIALTVVTVGTVILKRFFPDIEISTIGTRFAGGIPRTPPTFSLPWNFPGPGGQTFAFSFDTVRTLMPSAFAIAMLGAIESLLSAVVADGMAQTHHDPDAELVALGTGNILCPFFGGIAATGAIARTATNIRYGAKSPLAAVIHAIFVFLVVLLFAPYVSFLPMAALAALLVLVAYNMSELKHFVHIVKVAPKSDVVVLLICFSLTVVFDMVVGVTAGVVLAAMLFMRRMAAVTTGHVLSESPAAHIAEPLPKEIMLYEIAGPLFFGAAQNAIDAVGAINTEIRVLIFVMSDVPAMDFTGVVALESAVQRLVKHGKFVILAGVKPQPKQVLRRSHFFDDSRSVRVCNTIDDAVKQARGYLLAANL